MGKRGQINQIFVWLLVLVVAVAIIFYGIKVIKKSERLKDDVLVLKFFSDLDKKLSQYYYLDVGSKGSERFSLPGNVQYVCFVNGRDFDARNFDSVVGRYDEGLIQALRPDPNDLSKPYSNLFVGPMNLYEENRFKLETKFFLDKNPLCRSISSGILNINFENLGVKQGVKIS